MMRYYQIHGIIKKYYIICYNVRIKIVYDNVYYVSIVFYFYPILYHFMFLSYP